jgi:hypothetical protein
MGHMDLADIVDHSLLKLPLQQQGMFLDAATVLRGQQESLALATWRAWHGPEASSWLRQLQQRSLVDVDDRGCLQMHDVIAARARGILLDPHWGPDGLRGYQYGSRVWLQGGKVQGVQQVRHLHKPKDSWLALPVAAWLSSRFCALPLFYHPKVNCLVTI